MTTTTQAIAKRDEDRKVATPKEMVKAHEQRFAELLPTHIPKSATWVAVAQAAIKTGKRAKDGTNRTELEVAAANNPEQFMRTLLHAARLGLEPGTEQFYLTPWKVKGRLEILGIVGYQGYVELMHRAGAVESIVAECVHESDEFHYSPGTDVVPRHVIDWDADDRGPLRLVYAYARMKGGATSRVVVLNRAAIARIKASGQGSTSDYSPWTTHEPAMWLKSAVRQLAKWVPTSSEYVGGVPAAVALSSPAAPLDAPELDLPPEAFEHDDEPAVAELVCPDCSTEMDGDFCPQCDNR